MGHCHKHETQEYVLSFLRPQEDDQQASWAGDVTQLRDCAFSVHKWSRASSDIHMYTHPTYHAMEARKSEFQYTKSRKRSFLSPIMPLQCPLLNMLILKKKYLRVQSIITEQVLKDEFGAEG